MSRPMLRTRLVRLARGAAVLVDVVGSPALRVRQVLRPLVPGEAISKLG